MQASCWMSGTSREGWGASHTRNYTTPDRSPSMCCLPASQISEHTRLHLSRITCCRQPVKLVTLRGFTGVYWCVLALVEGLLKLLGRDKSPVQEPKE